MKLLLGIVAAALVCAAPAWADTILYAADNAPAVHGEVYRLGLDGKLVDLSRSPFPDLQPRLSPDGRWVAFVRQTGDSATVWIVHPNGSGLRRISSVLPLQAVGVETAWSPDSRRLAVVGAALYLVGPGVRQRVVAHLDGMVDPHWSPDGTLLTIRDSFGVDAFTADGRRAWEVDGSGNPAGWSPRGLFASSLGGRETVYDERGRALATFPGGEGAWSLDGSHLAVHHGNRLDVRTAAGRLVRSTAIPGLQPESSNGIRWAGRNAVLVGGLVNERVVRVDVRTGRLTRASSAVFATAGVPTVRVGDHFAFRVGSRTVGRLPGCTDDGGPGPAEAYAQLTRDRRSIVYQSYCVEPLANLWTLDGRITDVKAQEQMPAWSPDGTHIAFTRAEAVGLSCKGCPATVWVSDANGANAKPLTRADPDSSWDYNPSWSPDGTSILYAHSTVNTFGELFVVAAAGGTPRDLHIAGNDAAWGPQRIAYVDSAGLWTVAPDGSGKQQVARGTDLFAPARSRTGALACLDTTTLVVVTAQGTTRIRLPFRSVRDLAWSPDGTRLAVVARAKGAAAFDVYSLRADGTGVKRLTENVDAFNVSWR